MLPSTPRQPVFFKSVESAPGDLTRAKSAHIASTTNRRSAIIHPFADFWLLGGASILVWAALAVALLLRDDSMAVQQRFLQLGMSFAFLSLVCNHPHFLISYRFGYGRGLAFILRHWFALLAVPGLMLAAFTYAYLNFDAGFADGLRTDSVNHWVGQTGLSFRFGGTGRAGPEILGLSIWAMYLTVGWHYAKQVYGAMLVYARFDHYRLVIWQKLAIRWSVFSIAVLQFITATSISDASSASGTTDVRFPGIVLSSIGFPSWLLRASQVSMVLLSVLFLAVLITNYVKFKRWPSINFVVPWLAFVVWWAPLVNVPEFFMLIPFFHSLQYLPFA